MNWQRGAGNVAGAVRSFRPPFTPSLSSPFTPSLSRGVVFLLILAGCKGSTDPTPWCRLGHTPALETTNPTPTWSSGAGEVVLRKCSGCHTAGGMAPFPLETYEQVMAYRPDIRAAVASRTMPPWQAARCCNHYFEDRSLTEDEVQ